MFPSQLTEEEKVHRRQLTEYAIKLMLLAAGLGLVLELVFYLVVLSPQQQSADQGLRLLISVTAVAVGLIFLMLAANRLRKVPYWIVPTIFLLSLTFLTLFSDTALNLINGPATMILMVPILLSGVLICAYAPFAFSTIVAATLVISDAVHPGIELNPFTIVSIMCLFLRMGLSCCIGCPWDMAPDSFLLSSQQDLIPRRLLSTK